MKLIVKTTGFISKQITDIKKYGLVELLRKLNILGVILIDILLIIFGFLKKLYYKMSKGRMKKSKLKRSPKMNRVKRTRAGRKRPKRTKKTKTADKASSPGPIFYLRIRQHLCGRVSLALLYSSTNTFK